MYYEILDKPCPIICLYLSKEERDNEELRESLKAYYKNWKDAGYQVAVLLSGDGDKLVEHVTDLLRYNKYLFARNEVRREMAEEKAKREAERKPDPYLDYVTKSRKSRSRDDDFER